MRVQTLHRLGDVFGQPVMTITPEQHRQPIGFKPQQALRRPCLTGVVEQIPRCRTGLTQAGQVRRLRHGGHTQHWPVVLIELPEQQRIVTLLACRAAPVQQGGLTQHAPAVGVACAKPFGSLAASQPLLGKLQQHHLTRHVRLQTQLSRFIHQAVGTIRQQQARQQVFAALRPPLKISLLTTLFHEHLGSHLHQLAIHADLVRLAGDAEHAHQLMVEHQRQVDTRLDTAELRRCQ